MWTEVPRSICVDYLSLFAPCYDYVIIDDGCPSTVDNNGCEGSVGETTMLTEIGDAAATESSDVPTLDSRSSVNKSVNWSDFVGSVDIDGSIEHERMFSKVGSAVGLVGVS